LIALNHTSYVDWIPASIASYERRRRLRFMIKAEMQDVKPVNYVIKHAQLIPVDRTLGAEAFAVALQRLGGSTPTPDQSRQFRIVELSEPMQKRGHDGVMRSRRDEGGQR
jgi:1-acyl-sn-glycerol-3-phosphate acyltransferase